MEKNGFRWLQTQNIPFVIRIKENALVSYKGNEIPIRKRFENLNIHQQTSLCKARSVYDLSVYLSAIRLKDQYLILASNQQAQAPLETYKKRWGIEVLFANLKSRGFDLEATHLVHQERIEKLIALLAIACTWAHLIGEWGRPYKTCEGQDTRDGRKKVSFGMGWTICSMSSSIYNNKPKSSSSAFNYSVIPHLLKPS